MVLLCSEAQAFVVSFLLRTLLAEKKERINGICEMLYFDIPWDVIDYDKNLF